MEWCVALSIATHTCLYLHIGNNITKIKRNHTIKMNESTHNQIMISFALYFITISSSFLYINRCKSTQKNGTQRAQRNAYAKIKYTLLPYFIDSLRSFDSSYWPWLDFKGESINRHKLTNIQPKYAWCTLSFVHDNISMSN